MSRSRDLKWVPTEKVIPNPRNPRQKAHFSKEQLLSLRNSITTHGILDPLIVQPWKDDHFLLIEGERRYTVAMDIGIKELPAVVVNKMDEHDQIVVMFNVHGQRRGWEVAEELQAIKEMRELNGHKSDDEVARELGISLGTYRDRLRVLNMGSEVVADIARENLDYSSALRAGQAATTLAKKRPELVKSMGGEKAVEKKLLMKAKSRPKGISQELVEIKRDLVDKDTSDEMVQEYIEKPEITLRDARKTQISVTEKRKVEDLGKSLRGLEREIRGFSADLSSAPNLRDLRTGIASLIEAAQDLEVRVTKALMKKDEPGN